MMCFHFWFFQVPPFFMTNYINQEVKESLVGTKENDMGVKRREG